MTHSHSFSLLRQVLVLAILLSTAAAHAETRAVTFSEGHAVREAVDRLEAVYDVPITYEDPPMSYEQEVAKAAKPLFFSYEVPAPDATLETRKALASEALANMLQNYAALWWGGDMFKVVEGNGGFEIVPVQYLDKAGHIVKAQPILDTPISLPSQDRTPAETIVEICKAVSAASGGTLMPGSLAAVPNNTMERNQDGFDPTVTFSASNEPARDVLARLFAQLPASGDKAGPCKNRGIGGNGDQNCYWDVPANLTWQVWCGEGICLLHTQLITPPGTRHGTNWLYRQQHKDDFSQ